MFATQAASSWRSDQIYRNFNVSADTRPLNDRQSQIAGRVVLLPPMIESVVAHLALVGAPWALAGGWALDLAYNVARRDHADVDIAIFRDDQRRFRHAFEHCTCEQVVSGVMLPWPAESWIAPPIHELHIRTPADGRSVVELLMNERDGSSWVYRRDSRIRRAMDDAVQTHHGIPVLAPEIVLLYKSKAPRAIDQTDFERILPVLSPSAAVWLHIALVLGSSGHPWAVVLSETGFSLPKPCAVRLAVAIPWVSR